MKKLILYFFVFFNLFFIANNTFPQAGKNMRLIKRVDPVNNPSFSNYSALWGYESNGREYAILGGFFGTYFIDITDSLNMPVIGMIPSTFSMWREMKTYSHYAYIVSEGDTTTVQIVDLINLPNSIRYAGRYTAPQHNTTHSISQSGPYLYLNGSNPEFGNGVAILDLSINPEQPVLRGKWNNDYIHDCRVVNDTIWACNISSGYVTVINAINKDSLTTITRWNNLPYPFPHNCALTPGRNHIFTTDETYEPPGKLKVWNIRDLSDVTLQKIWIPELFDNCIIHNVELYGIRLVAAYYEAGMKLLDVSNPVNPIELGWYDTYPENNSNNTHGCWGVYMFPSGKIIASDRQRGLFVLRHNPPQSAAPAAEFMASKPNAFNGDSIQLIDCSTNSPNSYQWTITGPQNFSSTLPNPKFRFTGLGFYSVKLRISNAYGTDSITKINYIKINGSLLTSFTMTGPVNQTLFTNSNDTSRINFKWTNASAGAGVTYKLRIRSISASEVYLSSDNDGSDTSITIRKSRLDSIARQLGLTGDSVITTFKAFAYNGVDSLATSNALLVILKSTTVGIQNISSEIPGEYRLYNNYPNPFNPGTIINYQLSMFNFVSLKVFDVLGNEISTLVNEKQNAGSYEVEFNGTNLPSGVYYYSLILNRKVIDTKKMMLIK